TRRSRPRCTAPEGRRTRPGCGGPQTVCSIMPVFPQSVTTAVPVDVPQEQLVLEPCMYQILSLTWSSGVSQGLKTGRELSFGKHSGTPTQLLLSGTQVAAALLPLPVPVPGTACWP
ncbi:Hypothetical predicted protein, partial [Marmota monax]